MNAYVKATALTAAAAAVALTGFAVTKTTAISTTNRRIASVMLAGTSIAIQDYAYAQLPQNRLVKVCRFANRFAVVTIPMSALNTDEQFDVGIVVGEYIAKKLG